LISDPSFDKNSEALKKFRELDPLKIERIQAFSFYETKFDTSKYMIVSKEFNFGRYDGMVDKLTNQLNGIGRYTDLRFNYIFEGQWLNN
jgi:hypothetical protein